MIAAFELDQNSEWNGPAEPTEWRCRLASVTSRPAVGGIVHAHSIYACVLAICRRNVLACHDLMAAFGGTDIRCAAYARCGARELSVHALKAREGGRANQDWVATRRDLKHAMWLPVELETIAKQYDLSRLIDDPMLLNEAEIEVTGQGFSSYGADSANPQRPRRAGSRRRACPSGCRVTAVAFALAKAPRSDPGQRIGPRPHGFSSFPRPRSRRAPPLGPALDGALDASGRRSGAGRNRALYGRSL
jgi:L-fuculose-phosphate aldolase